MTTYQVARAAPTNHSAGTQVKVGATVLGTLDQDLSDSTLAFDVDEVEAPSLPAGITIGAEAMTLTARAVS